jgi:hypothetical protein
MADHAFAFSWENVIARLLTEAPDTVIKVSIAEITHPLDAGMSPIESLGDDKRPQFGRLIDEKLACHVVVCGDWYHARLYVHGSAQLAQTPEVEVLDRDDGPARKREMGASSLARLIADHPGLAIVCVSGIGALVATCVSPKKQRGSAALAGTLGGLAVSLAAVAVETANASPKTSEVAQGLFAVMATAGIAGRPAARVIKLTSPPRSPSTAGTAPKAKAKAKRKPVDDGLPI